MCSQLAGKREISLGGTGRGRATQDIARDVSGRRPLVLTVPAGVRIYLACGATDTRRGFDSLSVMAQEVLKQEQDPFSGAVSPESPTSRAIPSANCKRDFVWPRTSGGWRHLGCATSQQLSGQLPTKLRPPTRLTLWSHLDPLQRWPDAAPQSVRTDMVDLSRVLLRVVA
jgi:transposase